MSSVVSRFSGAALVLAAATVLLSCSPEEDQQKAADELIGRLDDGLAAVVPNGGARAIALLAEAEQAANVGRDDQARSAYQQALAIYQDAGDLSGQGRTLLGMATLARYGGQGEVAREIYSRARAAFAAAGDALGEAKVVFAIAELDRARFYNEDARDAFGYAADVFREHGEWALEAQAMLGIADSERRLNRIYAADNAVSRAQALFEILGDPDGQEGAERAWDELLTYINDADEARLEFAYDIGYADQGGSRLREAQGYLGLGLLDSTAGRPSAARESFEAARLVFAEMKLENGIFDAWAGQGDMERRLGHGDAARSAYERALVAYEPARVAISLESREHEETAIGSLDERVALVLLGLGDLDVKSGLDPTNLFDRARTLVPEGIPQVDGALLLGRGGLYQNAGRADEAAAAFQAAEKIFSGAGLDLGTGQALLAQANLASTQGATVAALELYPRALNAFLVARDKIGESDARWAWANALSATDGNQMEANIQYRIVARVFDDLDMREKAAAARVAADALD